MPRDVLKERIALEDYTTFRAISFEYVDSRHWMARTYSDLLGLPQARSNVLARMRFSSDRSVVLQENVAYCFKQRQGGYRPGRYNTTSFPCLYSSCEARTASIEKLTYLLSESAGVDGPSVVVFDLRVTGIYWDLTGVSIAEPRLKIDDYSFTQEVAELARRDSAGLRAPSARCNGTNVATFEELAVQVGDIREAFRCQSELPPDKAYDGRELLSD